MNLGFITTSRADFGIYIPLLNAIRREDWQFYIFAGGMHTSTQFGNSVALIEDEYHFPVAEKIESLINDDSPLGLSKSMALTTASYSDVFDKYKRRVDLVFAMGDRFEMFSAALSAVPFNIRIAHLHGGEITLGAIDNKFRHALTSISDYHFVSTKEHADRVVSITGSNEHVYNVGALGIDGIAHADLYTPEQFFEIFNFDVNSPFVLVTYHPETVDLRNEIFINELIEALIRIPYTILCTLPNADTEGSIIRFKLLDFETKNPLKIRCFENLGQKGYLSAMKYCTMMIGNTSSGIIEAASFNKVVINVGNRQKGRLSGKNVVHVINESKEILNGIQYASEHLMNLKFDNFYGDGNASERIIKVLKTIS